MLEPTEEDIKTLKSVLDFEENEINNLKKRNKQALLFMNHTLTKFDWHKTEILRG